MSALPLPPSDEPDDPELKRIAQMDRPALIARWEEVFGCPIPRACGVTLLRCAVAWQYQMAQLAAREGGAAGKKRSTSGARAGVDALSRRLRRATHLAATRPTLSPGTRLVREWQGKTHHVTVMAEGFEYAGKPWKSLSAIARAITGTAWSGPAFFAIKKAKGGRS